jgi:hypothetical protein
MSKKSRRNARKNARHKAQHEKPVRVESLNVSSDAKATPSEAPNIVSKRRFTMKRPYAIITLLCLVATPIVTYWVLKPTQQAANEAKQANDRNAGRLSPKAEIVELIPALKSAEMKPLVKVMHPAIKMFDDQGQQEACLFVDFDDIHAFCTVNPRIRLKNTGNEIIESVQIHVEELSVAPLTTKGPYYVRDPRDRMKKELIRFTPQLDPTQTENCLFAEKFKPGDEAFVPIWRPLVKAILGAHVFINSKGIPITKGPQEFGNNMLVFPEWNGKYHGAFAVRLFIRAVGAATPDRTGGKPIPLGFIWSARGFKDEDCKRILEKPMPPVKVVSGEEMMKLASIR